MNAIVLQCGGPTAVVNTTLAAIVRRWGSVSPGLLFGGRYGLAGLLTDDWLRLAADGADRERWLRWIEATSGMALGGGRVRLSEQDLDSAVVRLVGLRVGIVFLIGGNGTMAAGRALAARADRAGTPLQVVAVPKTIDNDIPGTDICPGFPSAARFLIDAVRDVAADAASMRGYEDVVLFETMGRHAGWLAASTMLARAAPGDAPHIVLLPERPVALGALVNGIRDAHARHGTCLVTVAEGVRDQTGVFLAERCPDGRVERDASGQVILGRSGGPLPYLAARIREGLGLRCRLVRPDVLQRSARAYVSALDRDLAALAGTAAVDALYGRESAAPIMIGLRREGAQWRAEPVPLGDVRGERTLPAALHDDASGLGPFVTSPDASSVVFAATPPR
jgi:ATP-dependent phosphofructokinase / diphosphate-dependent phosphofructokinase